MSIRSSSSRRPIQQAFAACRAEGRAALIAYLAAGDPDLATTERLADRLAAAGADILELGIPFSDPLADGPIIQAAYTRALSGGVRVEEVVRCAGRIASGTGLPVVLMTDWNPVLAMEPQAFCERAAAQGVSGVLVPDLLPEDSGPLRAAAAECGLDTIFLTAPGMRAGRLAAAASAASGFLYVISRRGVTGPSGGVGEGLEEEVARAREVCDLPVAVGFGVSDEESAERVARAADGVIVGSAFVKAAAEAAVGEAVERVGETAERIMEGIRRAASAGAS